MIFSITDYVRSYWTKLLGDSMTTVTTEELETIRELRQQRDELMKVLRQADCACSLRERDSGHVIGCWKPDVDAALAKMKP